MVYGGRFHGHQCPNLSKVVRDGEPYCGTHDPIAVEAKRKARDAEWNRKWAEQQKQWSEIEERRKAIDKLCGHIPTSELHNYKLVRIEK